MANQKIENLLNLALESTPSEREKSQNLNVGYDQMTNTWDIIVKYHGDILTLEQVDSRIRVVELLNNFAIITLPQEMIEVVANLEEIEYIEKPKRLYFEVNQGRAASCINAVQEGAGALSGRGTIVAVLDSGIDYTHPDFRNEDGTTRILSLWDQTLEGEPPAGYRIGAEFTEEEINRALMTNQPLELVDSIDTSTHGTHVAGIAAGNGRASQGRYRGVAPQASLLIVKLGVPRANSFPRTSELMQAVDYVIRRALELLMPVAVNISFGNTYGSHSGNSLLETYLDSVSNIWKNVIVVGTGNEGSAAGHTSGRVEQGRIERISLAVGNYESTVNVQLWKDYADIFRIWLVAPSGERVELFLKNEKQTFFLGQTKILLYYGSPTPYSVKQEIYMDFLPLEDFVDSGIWLIELEGARIIKGLYEMWLPSTASLNPQTEFLFPSEQMTLTIPSTSNRVISVAAYDSRTNSYADFSGRGYEYTGDREGGKPDLAAPGVGIMSTSPGGGYTVKSGTSMATPFVTGSAALLMEYGIVENRDPYLYSEKVKAYLIRGTKPIGGIQNYPSAKVGWGALCLADSLPL